MVTGKQRDRALILLKRLARANAIIMATTEEFYEVLRSWDDMAEFRDSLSNLLGSEDDPSSLFDRPLVNSASMTVTWGGRTCRLGHTILFKLMERLARRPNQYIPTDRLIRDVWEGYRSDDAVRAAVMRLKRRLKGAKMPGLAKAIRAAGEHYGLMLDECR